MSKKMLINALLPEESRVAIVQDGLLSELDIEIAGKEQTKGNIHKAVVVRVEPGLQAAFVDFGAERMGFLQMGEIHPGLYGTNRDHWENKDHPRINEILRRGQEILVQITKEERGGKGAALTSYLSLPGRYMVLMSGNDTKGISRKISEESERKDLKKALGQFDIPENMGVIVRTAAIGKEPEELKRDFDYLKRVYNSILERSEAARGATLIYKESNLVIRSIRDYFSSDMEEVLVDDPEAFAEAREFFRQVMPDYAGMVKLHQENRPIFSRYQIEEQIALIGKNHVPLPSGGSIVIDSTEALVAIDVNSGKAKGEGGLESTAFKTNMEAAEQAARQLRLRDLGGLIVIDFIDMRNRKHIRDVEKTLKDALKQDKARVTVGRISQFGLLEMSRQRIKAILGEGAFLPCPHCAGAGKVRSPESQAVAFMRRLHAAVTKGQIGTLTGELPQDVAAHLLNHKREELYDMEKRYDLRILIHGRVDFAPHQSELSVQKREKKAAEEQNSFEVGFSDPQSYQLVEQVSEEAKQPQHTSEEDLSQPESEGSEEGAAPSGRKRRRRRGRRSTTEDSAQATADPGQEQGETVSDQEPADALAATETETPATIEEPSENAEANDTAEQSPEAPSRPRRRRSRGRRRSSTAETNEVAQDGDALPQGPEQKAQETDDAAAQTAVQAAPQAQEPMAEAAKDDGTESISEEPAQKPARRRRSRSRGKAATGQDETSAIAAAPESVDQAAATASAPEGSTLPSAQELPPVTTAEESPASQEPVKPKRPTRRKKATPATENQPPQPEIIEAVREAGEQDPTEEPAAPKRRRSPAKKTETAEATTAPEAAPAASQDQPEAEEKKPAPRKRRTTKKVADSEGAAPTDEAAAPAATSTDEAPKKAVRKSAPRKKKAEEGESAVATEPATDTEAPEKKKPAPRKRAPRKKAEEPSEG